MFHKIFKAIVAYMGYFASRYVGNDIQNICGNLLDTPVAKTFTLFCIMFQATDNLNLSITMTIVFLLIQYVMSITPQCGKYIEKTDAKRKVNIHATAWAKDVELDSLNRPLR